MSLFHYRGPIIFFWIVEWHDPARVARQLSFQVQVPPPLPPPDCKRLHKVCHNKKSEGRDWEIYHEGYIQTWGNRLANTIDMGNGFMNGPWDHYLAWFNREGMRTVYWRGTTARNAFNPIAHQGRGVERTFNMQGEVVQRTVNSLPFSFNLNFKKHKVLTKLFN